MKPEAVSGRAGTTTTRAIAPPLRRPMVHAAQVAGSYRSPVRWWTARGPAATYLAVTFAGTWLLWAPLVVLGDRVPSVVEVALTMAGSLVPSATAILLLAVARDRAGLGDLRSRLLHTRVGVRWYAALFGLPLLVPVAVIAAASLGAAAPDVDITVPGAVIVFLLSIFPGSALGEELGWRGLLLPRLLDRGTALAASLTVGALWGAWHLPLWLTGADARPLSVFPVFLVSTAAISVIMTWMHLGTGRSLFVVVLFHAAANLPLTLLVAPLGSAMATPFSIYAALLLVATVLIVRSGGWGTWMRGPTRTAPAEEHP